MTKPKLWILFAFVSLFATKTLPADPLSVTSPNGKLSIAFEVKSNPQPYLPGERMYYRISYQGSVILKDSPLGLDFYDAPALDHGLEVVSVDHQSHNRVWETVVGARKKVPDHYNELTVHLRERFPILPSAATSIGEVRAGFRGYGILFCQQRFRLCVEHGKDEHPKRR